MSKIKSTTTTTTTTTTQPAQAPAQAPTPTPAPSRASRLFSRLDSRYSRQEALQIITPAGQQRLSKCTVLIIGCGALGSMQAELLSRAGIGTLRLVDRDILEIHNLNRQLLYDENDVAEGLPKAEAAARRLQVINSSIKIEPVVTDVTPSNVLELVQSADLVLDGTDNYETRYLINDAAVEAGKPWVYGGAIETSGSVMLVVPGVGPCLRCVFPDPPDSHSLATCETQGILNAAVAWVASLQVALALKTLLGQMSGDEGGVFKLHSLDIWQSFVNSISVTRQENCVCCSGRDFQFLNQERVSFTTVFCSRNSVQFTPPPGTTPPDLSLLRNRLAGLGRVRRTGYVLEFIIGEKRMILFPDGRVLVMGTTDLAQARTMVAKYVGA